MDLSFFLCDIFHDKPVTIGDTVSVNRKPKETVGEGGRIPFFEVEDEYSQRRDQIQKNRVDKNREGEIAKGRHAGKGDDREGGYQDSEEDKGPGVSAAKETEPCEEIEDSRKEKGQDKEEKRGAEISFSDKEDVEESCERKAGCKHRIPGPERNPSFPQVKD